MIRIVVYAIAAVVLTGCGQEEVLGAVAAVEAPDTVEAAQRFTVTVTTRGPDGCWQKERTAATISGLTATIIPYDVDTGSSGAACPQEPVEIAHIAELTFDQTGTALIRIRGRDGTDREHEVVVQ